MKLIAVSGIILILILSAISIGIAAYPVSSSKIYVVEINGMIGKGSEYVLENAIKDARDGELLIVCIDTPGGISSSMNKMIEDILSSPIPVVVYVSPKGADAFSAGAFILMASDIAAMAPFTTIGACQPRIINPAGMPEEAPQKEINAYAAKMVSLAEIRGRNVTAAEKFVKDNLALTEKEALESNVIEIVADDLNELIEKLNGREVGNMTLRLDNATVIRITPTFHEKAINYLTDPQIASILFTIGLLGIIIGFLTPTFHLPESIGVIFLVLGMYGFSYIGIGIAGVILIILGIVFLIIEVHTPTFGFWTGMALLSMIFGIMLLPVSSEIYEMPSSWYTSFRVGSILLISVIMAFFVYALIKVAQSKRRKPRIGENDLVGMKGVAITDVSPKGQVRVMGEIWKAESDEEIRAGEEIVVVEQKRLLLRVKKA
ncbi:MAG: nodulation protein NfeD [Thermoplasmata archaeon]|nr:nodulation protein NfeD [Thermoplasmata archaeon]